VYDGGMNRDNVRKEIEAADDTGLVAGEEIVALPLTELHAALPHEHHAHATIDALHAEIRKISPHRETIENHVGALRALPELEAVVANWWDDPRTQRFIDVLGRI
jgi:hypothetical protein